MKTKLRIVGWLVLLALSMFNLQLSTAHAQGTAFTYQGRLNNGASPTTGIYDLRFTIYDAMVSGNPVGVPVTNSATGVTNGLFTVTVDFGSGVFTGPARWLQLDVRTNGGSAFTELSPREPVLPMPYAIFAHTASNLLGTLPATQLGGTMANSQLANNSITVTAGTGLTGGGTVALGGSTTLNNGGVLSVTGNADITASTLNGAVTLGDTATDANTAGAIVKRDASGNFSAGVITGNGGGLTNLNASNLTGSISNISNIYLPATTAGAGIIYLGNAWIHTYNGNFFAGLNAGNLTMSGDGIDDIGVGHNTLSHNTNGSYNVAVGDNALYLGTNASHNTAIGYDALYFNRGGGYNIAVGYYAGFNITGSSNIDIGNTGLATDTNVIRIGDSQTQTFIAGVITGNGGGLTSLNGAAIAVGTVTSSALAAGAVSGSQIASNTITSANVADGSLTGQDFTNTARIGFIVIPDPTPAAIDGFGVSVASVGTNRFVVGACYKTIGGNVHVGQAYLYDVSGTLLATITNPVPAAEDYFGSSVAGVGANRFVVGADKTLGGNEGVGQAYLYDAGGTLLATITNPVPAASDYFGSSVGGVGTNRIVIGASGKTIGGKSEVGQAYLYDAGGTLLATITNPVPAANDSFGYSVAGVGTNRIVIGASGKTIGGNAYVGQAYLYDVSGTLLATITNPAPAYYDQFGASVAGVGTNRFVIGAQAYNGEFLTPFGTNLGKAYLYDASGMLLGTITNPAPATNDFFGAPVAGVGTSRFVIGAYNKTIGGNLGVGQAYLFDTTVSTPGLIADGVAPNSVGLEQLDITSVDSRYVLKTGDTMTGPLNVGAMVTASSFAGSGAGLTNLTNLNASQLTSGTVPLAQLPSAVVTNNESGVTLGSLMVNGTFSATNTIYVDVNAMNSNSINPGLIFGGPGSTEGITSKRNGAITNGQYGLDFYTANGVRMRLRNDGNLGIANLNPTNLLMVSNARCDGSSWINSSDRNLKQDFAAVNPQTVLARVAALPVQTWSYKAQPEQKHLGPVAQDFHAAFGLGADDVSIATVDEGGVALAAIQGLNQKLEETQQAVKAKDAEIQNLEKKLDALQAVVKELAAQK